MVKLGNWNATNIAADWIAEQLEDDGYTPGHLVELGRQGMLHVHVALPPDSVKPPAAGMSYGLKAFYIDGIFEFDALNCHVLQTQGSTLITKGKLRGVSHQLNRSVVITIEMLRLKREVLEGYVAKIKQYALANLAVHDTAPTTPEDNGEPPACISKVEDSWRDESIRLAQKIGEKKWGHGERNISARNVSEPVAIELAKNPKWHGNRGPRDAGSIRSDALKGWNFIPPVGGMNGMSGTSGTK